MFRHAFLVSLFTAAMGIIACPAQDATGGEDAEYQSLFDGKTLKDWRGDERFWKVKNGAIVGETTPDNPASQNTFLIYDGGKFSDFILKFKYRVDGFNSGMQYRSEEKADLKVTGLQADFEAEWHEGGDGGTDKFTGMFFEEEGRMFMGQRGDAVMALTSPRNTKKPNLIKLGSVGDQKQLAKAIKRDDWNDYTIVAHESTSIHIVNGRVLSIGIDDDENNRRQEGILAIQLHGGKPMKIQVKDVQIRELR